MLKKNMINFNIAYIKKMNVFINLESQYISYKSTAINVILKKQIYFRKTKF